MSVNVELAWHSLWWACAAIVVYVYVGYPLLLATLARLFARPTTPKDNETFTPSVTLLISAYNEREVIKTKIRNSLELDYPAEQLEVLVVSDCSDDGTDEIVRNFSEPRVQLVRQEQRLGKSAGLNVAVPRARGEFLVFSDANAMYEGRSIRHLVGHFADARVGYVVGNARYADKNSPSPPAEAEGLYWKLETWMKKQESLVDSVVGGDGAIYAIRRELYSPLKPTDINDFMNPLQIIDRGYRGIFEPLAVSYEDTAGSFDKEFRRKIRIVSRSLNALRRVPGVLNPLGNPWHWLFLVSHKLLRWLAPFFLMALFAASILMWNSAFYQAAAVLQLCAYAIALVGWLVPASRSSWKPFSLAYYFCLVNVASFIGCIKCFRGDLSGTWTPPRHSIQGKA